MSDLISRQAAIEAFDFSFKVTGKENAEKVVEVLNLITERIKSLPSAERKGKWIPYKYGDDRWHKCTACGHADSYIEYVQRPDGTTGKLVSIRNFCPNCGADMRGESDGIN